MKVIKQFAFGIAALVAVPAVAAADHPSQPAPYAYDAGSLRTALAEVSADPRDGADVVDLRAHRRFTQLELRAREAPVRLRGVRIVTADGQVTRQRLRRWLRPGESVQIDLPGDRTRVAQVMIDYGEPELRRSDRTQARLEVYGVGERRAWDRSDRRAWHRTDRTDRDGRGTHIYVDGWRRY